MTDAPLDFDAEKTEKAFRSDAYRQQLGWGPKELQLSLDHADGFDAKYGTDTSGIDFATPPGTYVPTLSRMFREIMPRFDVRFEDYVFLDVGSGKGRAVLLASEYPFKRCLGLELSPGHSATAARNIAVYRSPTQRCFDLQAVCGDALTFDYPKDDLFVWLYNPFPIETMVSFAQALGRSLAEKQRLILVYTQQDHHAVFDNAAFLKTWGPQGGPCTIPLIAKDGIFPWVVYSNLP
jgi:SAM-dependent methyltransferase